MDIRPILKAQTDADADSSKLLPLPHNYILICIMYIKYVNTKVLQIVKTPKQMEPKIPQNIPYNQTFKKEG